MSSNDYISTRRELERALLELDITPPTLGEFWREIEQDLLGVRHGDTKSRVASARSVQLAFCVMLALIDVAPDGYLLGNARTQLLEAYEALADVLGQILKQTAREQNLMSIPAGAGEDILQVVRRLGLPRISRLDRPDAVNWQETFSSPAQAAFSFPKWQDLLREKEGR